MERVGLDMRVTALVSFAFFYISEPKKKKSHSYVKFAFIINFMSLPSVG